MTQYFLNPLTLIIGFAPDARGHAPTPPPLGPDVAVYYLNPLTTIIAFTAASVGHAIPLVGAQYRLIQPHYLANNRRYEVGETIRETDNTGPGDVPSGWVPSLAVDPLNSQAATAFYNAGPRQISYDDLQRWSNSQWANIAPTTTVRPVTFWVKNGNQFSLTGLGAGFPPITIPGLIGGVNA